MLLHIQLKAVDGHGEQARHLAAELGRWLEFGPVELDEHGEAELTAEAQEDVHLIEDVLDAIDRDWERYVTLTHRRAEGT